MKLVYSYKLKYYKNKTDTTEKELPTYLSSKLITEISIQYSIIQYWDIYTKTHFLFSDYKRNKLQYAFDYLS
jgi:hypothetical protein